MIASHARVHIFFVSFKMMFYFVIMVVVFVSFSPLPFSDNIVCLLVKLKSFILGFLFVCLRRCIWLKTAFVDCILPLPFLKCVLEHMSIADDPFACWFFFAIDATNDDETVQTHQTSFILRNERNFRKCKRNGKRRASSGEEVGPHFVRLCAAIAFSCSSSQKKKYRRHEECESWFFSFLAKRHKNDDERAKRRQHTEKRPKKQEKTSQKETNTK